VENPSAGGGKINDASDTIFFPIGGSKCSKSLVGSSEGQVILAGNLVPLVGVRFFRWDAFYVVAVRWIENVIVGGFKIPKMLLASGRPKKPPEHVGVTLCAAANSKSSAGTWHRQRD
jgi:hypothetical protein